MFHGGDLGLFAGAVALGAVHGIESGHGWPVAATYALDRANQWRYGFAAGLIIGIGHLVSSIAMVLAFFYAKQYVGLTQVNEPIRLAGDVTLGGPVSVVAGLLLLALGLREYRHGHVHGRSDDSQGIPGDGHTHDGEHEPDDEHAHAHGNHDDGYRTRLRSALPFLGGHTQSPAHVDEAATRGLLGIAWFAFLLGFAHEEEFEIIALCAGSTACLELMTAYAITVIVGIVGLTMLLIAGYDRFEPRIERYTPYLPAFSAAVLGVMGVGFITGTF